MTKYHNVCFSDPFNKRSCWIFTWILSNYWAELHSVAIPAKQQRHNYPTPEKTTFFCTALHFCVLTLLFAQLITFLHFHQRTYISEIWLHHLLLPHTLCQLSEAESIAPAAGGHGDEDTDNAHSSHRKCLEQFTEYSAYKMGNHYPQRTWRIKTSSSFTQLVCCLWALTSSELLPLFLLPITFVSVAD